MTQKDVCRFFAASRKYFTDDYFSSHNHLSYRVSEAKLERNGIKLGDFLTAVVPLGQPIHSFRKMEHTLEVKVFNSMNYAQIEKITGTVEKNKHGISVFNTKHFGQVGCLDQNIPFGIHKIMEYITELEKEMAKMKAIQYENEKIFAKPPIPLPRKSILISDEKSLQLGHFFEGIFEETSSENMNWICIRYVKETNEFLQGEIVGNKIQVKTALSKFQPTPRNFVEHIGFIVTNVRAKLNLVGKDLIFQNNLFGDAICRSCEQLDDYIISIKLLPKPVITSIGKIIYFEANEIKKNQPMSSETQGQREKVLGTGFQKKTEKVMNQRAVVLKFVENRYYVWNIDLKKECVLKFDEYPLEKGHFFVGDFVDCKTGKWICIKYVKPIDGFIDGGLNVRENIYFTITLEQFPTTEDANRRGSAFSEYFGEVFDGKYANTKITKELIGRKANVERRSIARGEYVWTVVKTFPPEAKPLSSITKL
nr:hypothetical protein C49A9.3 - Caenorhabditis elegans [Caenorhabditis elegans]